MSRKFSKIIYGQPKIGMSQFIIHVEDMVTVIVRTAKIKKSIEIFRMTVPMAAWSKPWFCDLSLAGIACSTAIGGMDFCV
jgi:hypothetical protein